MSLKGDPVDIRVHATNMSLSEDLREFAAGKVEHATRVFDDGEHIDVEFSVERNPRITEEKYRVEITSKVAGQVVRVESASFDERAALDLAIDKYERRLRKLKERIITLHRQPHEKRLNDGGMSVEEHNEDNNEFRIDRVKRFAVKPMTTEEAALQMELLGHSFYLFLNADTDRYGVLYRRRGGSLGLIEPE
jgi:putative sigma-54 modulation protein